MRATVVAWLWFAVGATAVGAEAGDPMTHALSDDPDAVVVQWSSSGGLSGGAAEGPDLVVRAGGRVEVGPRLAGGARVQGRIDADRLQALLDFAIDDNRFFATDEAGIEQALANAGPAREEASGGGAVRVPSGPPYLDAATTTIAIAADGRRHEVTVQGLFAAARDFPQIDALRRLRAIEMRLLGLAEEMTRPD